jgi:hypothetical protein
VRRRARTEGFLDETGDESVSIDLYVAGHQIVSATDETDAAYSGAGRIGLRADWTQVWIRDLAVVAL